MKLPFAYTPILLLFPFAILNGLNRNVFTMLSAALLAMHGVIVLMLVISVFISRAVQRRVLVPGKDIASVRFGLIGLALCGVFTLSRGCIAIYHLTHFA